MFRTLRKMADSGKVVVFISHKMGEVIANADRITVLRGGLYHRYNAGQRSHRRKIDKRCVGSADKLMKQTQENRGVHGDSILKTKDLCVLNDKGLPALRKVNMELYAGEIFGIAGVAGNGQRELSEVIAGLESWVRLRHVFQEDVSNISPKARIKKGFAFIPEDRLSMGLVPSMNLMENAILKGYDTDVYSKKGILNRKSVRKNTEAYISRYDIKNGGIELPVGLMSGGNQQKLLIAREINGEPKVIIAAYPVRGLDIGATEAIHKILMEQRNKGACILLISEELEELFEMADRIAVLNCGYMSEVFRVSETSYDEIGSLMIGIGGDNAGDKCGIA